MKAPAHGLRPGESVRAGLLRVAGALIAAARARIAQPSTDRAEDVHHVRTAIKGLRALLRLVRPVMGEERFTREDARLRATARLLAPPREYAVAQRTLSKLAKAAARPHDRQALCAVLAGFPEDRAGSTATETAMRKVARRLALIGQALRGLRLSARGWPALEPGLRKTYAQARNRMHTAWAAAEDEAFHRWRARVKNLYYQLKFLEGLWPRQLRRTLTRLKKLQEKLGDDHDLAVVRRLIGVAPAAFGGAGPVARVGQYLAKRSLKLRRATKPLGRAIFRAKPAHFTCRLGRHWDR